MSVCVGSCGLFPPLYSATQSQHLFFPHLLPVPNKWGELVLGLCGRWKGRKVPREPKPQWTTVLFACSGKIWVQINDVGIHELGWYLDWFINKAQGGILNILVHPFKIFLIFQEANYLQNVVAKIASYKPDIILVEKSIAFLARKYLQVSLLLYNLGLINKLLLQQPLLSFAIAFIVNSCPYYRFSFSRPFTW